MGGALAIAVFDKTASNPAARIGDAIAAFTSQAPHVQLQLHVASINAIERGVIDGSYHVGVIPAHRSSQSLVYSDLFGETMLLYCGAGHPLFGQPPAGARRARLGRAARLPVRGPGLPLAQHGTEPPGTAHAQRHRL